jgi:hypothetical protein
MRTKDLISLLQGVDPAGNRKVVIFDEFNGVLFDAVKSVTSGEQDRSVLINIGDIDEKLRAMDEEARRPTSR